MKRIFLLLSAALMTASVFSQANDAQFGANTNTGSSGKSQQKQAEVLNNRNKNEDKLDQLDITGLGGSTFSTMNLPNFSSKIASTNIKITLSLLTGANKAPGHQLVFTSESERNAYAVETQNGITSIFFPMSTYAFIQQKLETAVAQKKKVQLKITQNPDGFREGVLIF